MTVPLVLIQVGAASTVTFLVALAILVGLVYRWYSESTGDGTTEESARSWASAGFPLASWRYVYDGDKADANREIASVQQQADDLTEADTKARR